MDLANPRARVAPGRSCAAGMDVCGGLPAASRAAAPGKRGSPQFIFCAGFCWDDFGEWKVYVVKGKMSQAVLKGCIYSQGISRKVNFLNWGGGRGRREGLDRDQLP